MKMKIMTSFLLTLSIILNQLIPMAGLIPDFNGVILIIIIILNKSYSKVLMYGIFLGLLSALTTKAVNGQIPMLICKLITANMTYVLVLVFKNKFTNIVMFIGIFIDNVLFFTLWFWLNGILTVNEYTYLIVIEFIIIFIIVAGVNTIIGRAIMKLIYKCIEYDSIYKS